MTNQRFNFDESRLKRGQKEAAALLVEYDFSPKDERKTKQEIADLIGLSRKQLYIWESSDENFIAYKNYVAAKYTDSHLPAVYAQLIKGISNGSMKGIELFLKRIGDLNDKSEVTINNGANELSFEERRKQLLERLNDEDK